MAHRVDFTIRPGPLLVEPDMTGRTYSAVASSASGMVRHSALAVLRLITSLIWWPARPADRLVSRL
jgi:hypothetical protein